VIIIEELTKEYDKGIKALERMNLQLNEGTISSFAGPNGAGKTTTLRILSTLIRPTGGSVKISGFDVSDEPEAVRAIVGYLPERVGFYERFSGAWNLFFYSSLFNKKINLNEHAELIDVLALTEHLSQPVGKYSYGMKQKLGILRVLINQPEVLLLDEPMNALDIEAQDAFKSILKIQKEMGKIVLISTHVLPTVENICDRLILINQGRIITDIPMSDVNSQIESRQKPFSINDFYLEKLRK